jgi:integrase
LPGYGVTVEPSGHIVYPVRHRIGRGRGARQRELTIPGTLPPDEARRQARAIKNEAAKGRDLLQERRDEAAKAAQGADATLFEDVVGRFIKEYAKPRQRTWDQTERILKNNCAGWLKKRIKDITKGEGRELLRGFVSEGKIYKAKVTWRWLKKLFKWAYQEDLIDINIMDGVRIEIEKRQRDRVFTDAEIEATWTAADKLDNPEKTAFSKLIMLLAPRKTSLACITRADLNDTENPTLWTVPFELTKSRKTSAPDRIYPIPLPPLCQQLFKGVMKEGRLFPSLPVHKTKAGRPTFYGNDLKLKLVELGAPKDFQFHAWRHTIATFLKNGGHSKWERGLVLNHAESGVTADYSHGYPVELKLKLLTEWVDHVESLIGYTESRGNVIDIPDRQAATG